MDGTDKQPGSGEEAAHAVPCGCARALRAGPEAALQCACVRGSRDRRSSSEVRSAHSSSGSLRSPEHVTGAGVPMRDNGSEGERGESS